MSQHDLGLMLWTVMLAAVLGRKDAEHSEGNVPIVHWKGWLLRAALVTLVWLIDHEPLDPWVLLMQAPLFSFVFRWCYNAYRERSAFYLSSGSWYDLAAILLVTPAALRMQVWRLRRWHYELYSITLERGLQLDPGAVELSGSYAVIVHRAGLVLYLLEAASVAALLRLS